MKSFLIKISLFFAIVFAVDFAFGKVCDYLKDHTKGGFSGNVHYICEQCDEEILMMGSSRMRHHYVPQIIEDSLGMSCLNAGIDGNGIILAYGFLEMIIQRYSPKMIIYDVTSFDMFEDDNTKYLSTLKPYYYKEGIAPIFYDVNHAECWKIKSNLYRYNSVLFGLISDNIHPLQSFDKGYWPSYKVMDYDPVMPDNNYTPTVDSLKLKYAGKFIDLAYQYGVKLVFVASPTYFGAQQLNYNATIKSYCKNRSVPFIDCYYDNEICGSKEYWADAIHLNDSGARLFSRKIVSMIKRL